MRFLLLTHCAHTALCAKNIVYLREAEDFGAREGGREGAGEGGTVIFSSAPEGSFLYIRPLCEQLRRYTLLLFPRTGAAANRQLGAITRE